MPALTTDTLVIGAGVAGLTFRATAPTGVRPLTLECDPDIGGLCRVRRDGAFGFDRVLHVLFFRSHRLMALIDRHLPDGLHHFSRVNSIWQNGRCIPYPFQYNSVFLPEATRDICLQGLAHRPGRPADGWSDFESWLLGQFGPGFYGTFFKPYNEKLYRVPLRGLDPRPLQWTIPKGSDDAMRDGAHRPHLAPGQPLSYPRGRDGIALIPQLLERMGEGEIRLSTAVVEIDPQARRVITADGTTIRYRSLVSSLALPDLVARLRGVAPDIAADAARLKAADITVIRIGAERLGTGLPFLWTYFPDPEVPFYRLTRLERVSPDLAPASGTSILLECPGALVPERSDILALLQRLDILDPASVRHYGVEHLRFAFVLFEHGWHDRVRRLLRLLANQGIFSIGRYGRWQYGDIEMAIKTGVAASRQLYGRDARRLFPVQ